MGQINIYVGGGTVTGRRWAFIAPFYGNSDITDVDRRFLDDGQLDTLRSLGPWDPRDVVVVDGDGHIPEKAVVESATNLSPPAVFDTEEHLNVHASNIETGSEGMKHYVVADGQRYDRGVDGEEIVSLEWNVPWERSSGNGGSSGVGDALGDLGF